jgi:RNA methyltransferase, RsmD family
VKVIAGKYRGRVLKTLKGDNTRPTTSKNKESLFNIIGPYFQGGIALDLFAGSGSLGIEAISRGINQCYFVDNSYKATTIIKENLFKLEIFDGYVYKNDALNILDLFKQREIQFDLVFLDPPYKQELSIKSMKRLVDLDLLNSKAIVVIEEDKSVDLLKEYNQLILLKRVVYGICSLHIYQYQKELL